MGAVLIEGPKACGKTATAAQGAATAFRFDEGVTLCELLGQLREDL